VHTRPFVISFAALVIATGSALAQFPTPADGPMSHPKRCGTGIPDSETRGYVPLPRGDVFCPLVADPKATTSFVTYLRGDAEDFASDVASVGVADLFGLLRFNGSAPGDGVQVSLAGGVFAQFDLGAPSYDLINADYTIGLPLTVRSGSFSARLRVYHQSSHLGDEFLLRTNHPTRENLSFEAAEALLSEDLGPLRVYGGGEYYIVREPNDLPQKLGHAGAEFRPPGGLGFGSLGTARLIAGGDVKVVKPDAKWRYGISARAGIEVGRGRGSPEPSRRWSLMYEFYDGPSPYGQFFQSGVRLMGVGLHFTP
jgi:hypothetical protein